MQGFTQQDMGGVTLSWDLKKLKLDFSLTLCPQCQILLKRWNQYWTHYQLSFKMEAFFQPLNYINAMNPYIIDVVEGRFQDILIKIRHNPIFLFRQFSTSFMWIFCKEKGLHLQRRQWYSLVIIFHFYWVLIIGLYSFYIQEENWPNWGYALQLI